MNRESHNNPDNKTGNPEKAFREELNDRGSSFSDTNAESDARDKAKIVKSLSGQGQKMDSAHPDDIQEGSVEEMIERERKAKE